MSKIDSTPHSSAVEQRAAEKWRLLPREHGAYAQIVFPLLTALALGRGGAAQLYWAAAALAVFVAHEPLLILAGERGRRSHADLAGDAQKLASSLSVAALAAGILGWWYAPQSARMAIALPLILGMFLLPLIIWHREKTLLGELLVSLTFSTMLMPVALAGGVGLQASLTATVVWSVIFLLGTITVRAVIARVKKTPQSPWLVYASQGLSVAAITASIILLLMDAAPALAIVAVMPAAVVSAGCTFAGVHPRHLRTVGWSLVGSNLIALAALVAALR